MVNEVIKNLLLEAANHHKNGNLSALEEILKKIILIDPNFQEAYYNLGKLSENKKEYQKAITFYKKSLELSPKHLNSIINLTNCYEDINKINEAIKLIEKACDLYPTKSEVYFTKGRLLHKKQEIDKAFYAYKKSLEINNNFDLARLAMAQIEKNRGNFKEAKKIFKKLIKSDLYKGRVYYEIIDFLDKNEIDEGIKELKNFENNIDENSDEKIFLYFALGKMFEKIKKYDEAIHSYNLGNKCKSEKINYSINFDEERFNYLKKVVKKFISMKSSIGHRSCKPVFIIGMPRSGTTLIERIISSHSKVFGCGELVFFSSFLKKLNLTGKNILEDFNNLSSKNFSNIGKLYVEEIEKFSKKSKYITNKLPQNFLDLGLIKLSLPNAKIIHCERNSIDTCFSCYKTNFTEGNYYSYKFEDLGSFYLLYKKQMEFYKKNFGKDILNIKYENVINDLEVETKKILKYLDLPFENNCIEFYKNKDPIYTASLVQARKPIYKNSIDSWKIYKDSLKPLTDIIG